MIYVICGIIGSGKSTYASMHFAHVTECEGMTKMSQLQETWSLYEAGEDVAHVTTYPTSEELEMLAGVPDEDKTFILIDTDLRQAKANIIKRNRPHDMTRLSETLEKNKEIARRLASSKIPFERIQLFETGERW